ncbi:hypothetical protein ACLOJK_011660 [Asimina triloba]
MAICGVPLDACDKPYHSVILWLAVAAVVSLIFGIVTWLLCWFRVSKNNEEEDIEGNRGAAYQIANGNTTANRIKFDSAPRRYCNVHICTFEKAVPRMRLNALMKATKNFSKDNIIRLRRTGTVYMGTLPDGSSLAVNRMHDSQLAEKEFMAEMTVLGSSRHPNVLPLLGFCIARKERILVYKHNPKGTLHQLLHEGKTEEGGSLEWPIRLKIATGVARGLAWLHHSSNPCIIHRMLSSRRILLDENYEPKISNFRSAALIHPIDTQLTAPANVEFNNNAGINAAPEYATKVIASRAGDVFSFGVILLELITRQRPTKVADTAPTGFKGNLVEWIAYLEKRSILRHAIDKSLIGKGVDDELSRCLRVAIACVVRDPDERPAMNVVYKLLQSIGERYHFKDEDEMRQPQVRNVNCLDEQRIVVNTKIRKAASF